MKYSHFHNSGLAEWIDSFSSANPNSSIAVELEYHEDFEVYSLDIYDQSNNCLDSFNYLSINEITEDLKQSVNQFPISISI